MVKKDYSSATAYPDNEGPSREDLREIEHYLSQENPRIFEGINRKKKEELIRSFSYTLVRFKSHSGPLPDPETLREYTQLIDNGAERLMMLVERQQEHRHQLERKILPRQVFQSQLGQVFGFVIGLAGLGCGTWLALAGQDVVGALIAGTTVVSLVYVFVLGRKQQEEE